MINLHKFKKNIRDILNGYKEKKEELKVQHLEELDKRIENIKNLMDNSSSEEEKRKYLNVYNKLIVIRDRLNNV